MDVHADPHVLRETADTVHQVHRGLQAGVDAAGTAANRTLAQVRHALARATEEHRAAYDALAACYSSGESPDCSVLAARARQATDALQRAQQALRIVASAIDAFRGPRLRFAERSHELVTSGVAFVRSRQSELESMGAVQGSVARRGATTTSRMKTASRPSPAPSSRAQPRKRAGLPAGFVIVPLSMVDMDTCSVTSPADFKKGYSPKDLAWALDAFDQVIAPGLAEGKTKSDFQAMDQAAGRKGTRSYADTYAGFLEDAHVKLNMQPNGLYEIANGQHRIWVASRIGRTDIPAKVWP